MRNLFVATFLLTSAAAWASESSPATAAVATPVVAPTITLGGPAPREALDAEWLRGGPISEFAPGRVYILTYWSTTNPYVPAPGANLARALEAVDADAAVTGLVFALPEGITVEKLKARLARPSQRTPHPVALVTPGTPAAAVATSLFSHRGAHGTNTMVVRDGRVLWVGEAFDLRGDQLREFTAPGFVYEEYLARRAEKEARGRAQYELISKAYPAAREAGDAERAEAILVGLENDPEVEPFIFQRVCDTRAGLAMRRGDHVGAVAAMRKLMEKYPKEPGALSWVHKVITSAESLLEPGRRLAAEAAEGVARARKGEEAVAWWREAATQYRHAGDRKAALAALEHAERVSGPWLRLQALKSDAASASR